MLLFGIKSRIIIYFDDLTDIFLLCECIRRRSVNKDAFVVFHAAAQLFFFFFCNWSCSAKQTPCDKNRPTYPITFPWWRLSSDSIILSNYFWHPSFRWWKLKQHFCLFPITVNVAAMIAFLFIEDYLTFNNRLLELTCSNSSISEEI